MEYLSKADNRRITSALGECFSLKMTSISKHVNETVFVATMVSTLDRF